MKDIAAANSEVPAYRWYTPSSAPPFSIMRKPLSQCRVGLLSTSGCYVVGDEAFIYRDNTSYREIPADTPTEKLHFSHFTENWLVDARRDPNCVVPIQALHKLAQHGIIGEVAPHVFSVMGANYSLKQTQQKLAPQMADKFVTQGADVVLIVPM